MSTLDRITWRCIQRITFSRSALGVKVKQPVNNQRSSEEEEVEETVADNRRRKKSYPRGQNKRARETSTSSNEILMGDRVGNKNKTRLLRTIY